MMIIYQTASILYKVAIINMKKEKKNQGAHQQIHRQSSLQTICFYITNCYWEQVSNSLGKTE